MKDRDDRKYSRERRRPMRLQKESRYIEKEIIGAAVEQNPAVEWGERIFTGKMIARGGMSSGDVEGAISNSDSWTN